MTNIPLCVDLDGTLIYTDMLHESTLSLVVNKPSLLLKIPILLYSGIACMKATIAEHYNFSPSALPYNQDVIDFIKEEKRSGRTIILCTATDKKIANQIADYLQLFDDVIASDGVTNVAGKNKSDALVEKFGKGGFDYIGNSSDDLLVWGTARKAILANATDRVISESKKKFDVERVYEKAKLGPKAALKMFRPHQWLKNLLMFVPMIAAHEVLDLHNWLFVVLGFLSFSFCASTVYILNDLLDLESDRQHPTKKNRPFASGSISVKTGVITAPVMMLVSIAIGTFIGTSFLSWLGIYFLITCLYSVKLKQIVLIDCFTLAILYTLRIISGAAAVELAPSFWLLAFSISLFFSLSFVKRFSELQTQLLNGKHKAAGRGYFTDDAPLIQAIGVSSGYISALVFALYLNSEEILTLYSSPNFVLGSVLVLLFWISWIWLKAFRGQMNEDPVIFAVKDKVSLMSGSIFILFIFLGSAV
ncbi:TPA: UbiA family prenyltransferase [Vibrio cholerae]|uniref:UbiA family prenyltransferase n=1 Tax=Vibrio cholerae TaxID=666 RepID=UPI00115AC563|nr:UbiA family prenyltransferase [Vibrio cholerae]TQP36322.1 UbiA family prenyltransferase [Vibrio cholerae]TQP54474.1 UbiA family prenyltransferase [Vibrio cholerae]TQP64503.1 UbiA family prenyltransferase [Vibrio cholerae]TQP79766.1 UbiA family prenyltransferase [Vibrio cholerae]BCN20369.1 putative ubiquinone biosynthesis protein [Vibrio cholerae]